MTKKEAIAYLRKKQLLEEQSLLVDINPEAIKELDKMERYPGDEIEEDEEPIEKNQNSI